MQASIDFDGTLSGSIAGGGGGGGSDVSITPTYNQGTKIADYSIDGNEGTIYTPEIEITKYVSSGVKICEIEGVEIFAPSCGYIDTLGDSNVEQIGGFSQGTNVTPVNVKKVSYTNDVSNGEKIGTLTVGDTSYNVYQKPNTNINYSTTEQNTGRKWIDGRDIYQKTFDLTIGSTSGLQAFNVDLPCDFCIHTEESIMGEGERGVTVWATSAYIILSTVGNNVIEYYLGSSNYVGKHIYITVYYCKAVA